MSLSHSCIDTDQTKASSDLALPGRTWKTVVASLGNWLSCMETVLAEVQGETEDVEVGSATASESCCKALREDIETTFNKSFMR